jgi:hypothetical protein
MRRAGKEDTACVRRSLGRLVGRGSESKSGVAAGAVLVY